MLIVLQHTVSSIGPYNTQYPRVALIAALPTKRPGDWLTLAPHASEPVRAVADSSARSAAPAPMVTLTVDSPSVHWSPGNWAGNAGRGGGEFRQTWYNGAYCTWRWTTNSSSPQATLGITNQTPGSAISYTIDHTLVDNVAVPASGGIAIPGIGGPGEHVLTITTRNSGQSSRWNEANAFKITGLTVNGSGLAAPKFDGKWMMEVGDSITEGIAAGPDGSADNLNDYSYLVGQTFLARGYDYCVSACGYSGWIQPGDGTGDVPRYYSVASGAYHEDASRWDKIDAATSLLDSRGHISAYGATGQEPSVITINYLTNEALNGANIDDIRASVTRCLAALRHATTPATWILVYVPFNLTDTLVCQHGPEYVAALKSAVAAYQAAHSSDARTKLVDFGAPFAELVGSSSGDSVHPNLFGHALIAARATQTIQNYLSHP